MRRKLPPFVPSKPNKTPPKEGGGVGRRGRPELYDAVLADRICTLIAEGNSLRSVCRLKDMPGLSTVLRWLVDDSPHPEFRDQYARACEARADAMAEELQEIADEAPESPSGVNKARLRVDTRKWLMAKMKPKKYGDKVEQVHSGQVQHAHAMGTLPAAEGYRQMLEGPKNK